MKLRVLRRLTELALTIPEMWAKMIQHRFSTSRDPDPWGSAFMLHSWACGAAGSALPWHGRGRRFDPDQVHQISQWFSSHRHFDPESSSGAQTGLSNGNVGFADRDHRSRVTITAQ